MALAGRGTLFNYFWRTTTKAFKSFLYVRARSMKSMMWSRIGKDEGIGRFEDFARIQNEESKKLRFLFQNSATPTLLRLEHPSNLFSPLTVKFWNVNLERFFFLSQYKIKKNLSTRFIVKLYLKILYLTLN